jgi:hypothetical protein
LPIRTSCPGLASAHANPEKAEHNNLIVDSLASGAWAAGLGFPLWISVALFLAALLNHTITLGRKGILICVLAVCVGALASTTVIAFHRLDRYRRPGDPDLDHRFGGLSVPDGHRVLQLHPAPA